MTAQARALFLRGRFGEAEPLFREALQTRRATAASPDDTLIESLLALGWFLDAKGDYAEAEAHMH